MNKSSPFLVYLDHNILNIMLQKSGEVLKTLFDGEKIVAVYSNLNLDEISRSKGFVKKFLGLLKEIKARHLSTVSSVDMTPTGQAQIIDISPYKAYAFLKRNSFFVTGKLPLIKLIQKWHGGLSDIPQQAILIEQVQESMKILQSEANKLQPNIWTDKDKRLQLILALKQTEIMISVLDNLELIPENEPIPAEMSRREFETQTDMHSRQLNNLPSPNIVLQIWEQVKQNGKCNYPDADAFLGLTSESNSGRILTMPEKVGAIYSKLNSVGYWRDLEMKNGRGVARHTADMGHAGLAIFCHFLLTADERMYMKTTAAYEYLRVGTKVKLIPRLG